MLLPAPSFSLPVDNKPLPPIRQRHQWRPHPRSKPPHPRAVFIQYPKSHTRRWLIAASVRPSSAQSHRIACEVERDACASFAFSSVQLYATQHYFRRLNPGSGCPYTPSAAGRQHPVGWAISVTPSLSSVIHWAEVLQVSAGGDKRIVVPGSGGARAGLSKKRACCLWFLHVSKIETS